MPTIDSDAHVLECMATWDYLAPAEARFTPMIVERKAGGAEERNTDGLLKKEYWVVDGRLHEKDQNVSKDISDDSREMHDVSARIRHMDELEIDLQILYPTLMLRPIAAHAPLDVALCRSYNRWLADIWRKGEGRLRWVAAPPLMAMDKVRDELMFAKDNGACGIFMRGLECELPLSDPYFYPLYEIAGELDMAICVHLGNGSFTVHDFYTRDTTFTKFKLPTVGCFHSLIMSGTPAMFPKVRWGIVEVSANWLPYVINDLRLRFRRRGKRLPDNILKANNIYIACEVTDDLPGVLKVAGEDNLVIGTDYGHSDSSTEIEALRMLRDNQSVGAAAVDKILWDNPKTLYGIV